MKNNKTFRIAVSLILAAVFCFAVVTAFAAAEDTVDIPDAALRQALLDAADANSDGSLNEGELGALTGALDLSGRSISDLTGLEYLTGILSLDISDNTVRSIAPLTGIALNTLDVSLNYLDITEGSDDMADIALLQGAGCSVTYSPQKDIPVSGISLAEDLAMCPGDVFALTATVSPGDAADKTVLWSSSTPAVATVDAGTVTAHSVGTAIITAITQDGGYQASCVVTVKPDKLSSAIYDINGGLLNGVMKITLRTNFLDLIENDNADLLMLTADGQPYTGAVVGTGMQVQLVIGGQVRDTLTVIVEGDTNGDGAISITDYTQIRLDILGLSRLSGAFREAADVNRDGVVSITDYTLVRLDILAIKPIGGAMPHLPGSGNARIERFIEIALAQQGKPYVWGARGPDSFDCSGFVYYCLTQEGYSTARSTADTYSKREDWLLVGKEELRRGDLMFYWSQDTPGRIGHVGIYLGNGYHIHATSAGGCVLIGTFTGYYDQQFSHGRRVYQ